MSIISLFFKGGHPVNIKTRGDLVFVIQVILSLVLCGTQLVRAFESVQGASLSMQMVLEGFLVLHFFLALSAYRARPNRTTYQTMVVYTLYGVLTAVLIAVLLSRENYHWGKNDNQTLAVVVICTAVIAVCCWSLIISMLDTIPKSLLAITFKAIPQFMMAWKIASEGGAGIHGAAIVVGHISILIRMYMLRLSIRQVGWEKNLKWLLISEVWNELSWVAVSVAWLYWAFTT